MIEITSAIYKLQWPARGGVYRPIRQVYIDPFKEMAQGMGYKFNLYTSKAVAEEFSFNSIFGPLQNIQTTYFDLGSSPFSQPLESSLAAHASNVVDRRFGVTHYCNLTLMKFLFLLESIERAPKAYHFWIDSGLFENSNSPEIRPLVRRDCTAHRFADNLKSLAGEQFLVMTSREYRVDRDIAAQMNQILHTDHVLCPLVAGGIFGGRGDIVQPMLETMASNTTLLLSRGSIVTEQDVLTHFIEENKTSYHALDFRMWMDIHKTFYEILNHSPS